MPVSRFEECWPLPTESLPELPWNLNIVFLIDSLSSGNPVHVKKRDHQKFVGGFAPAGLLGSGRASMLPLGTLSLGLWVIAEDPAFIAGHQSIKNCRIWIDQLDHLPAVKTTSFFLIFSEHPWNNLSTNLLHLQFLANNCVYSSHTDIKLCSYCLYRHTTVIIHEILYLVYQLRFFWLPYSAHTSHHPSQTHCLPWISYATQKLMLDSCKMLQKQCEASIRFYGIFRILKQNFIAYRSSKMSSRPDCIFETHQLWQSGFRGVYSNSCCSCSFAAEIIKISQSSHKMYSNNSEFSIVNDNFKSLYKKVWKFIEGTS